MGREYSRIHRLLHLMRLVQARSDLGADDLARCLEVSTRQIFRDIDTLSMSGVPCTFDKETNGYRIARGFFMPPVELTLDEAMAMVVLMEQLPRDGQFPFVNTAGKVVEKIRCQLPQAIVDGLEPLDGNVRVDLARGMADDSPREVYDDMRQAIATRRALRCRYESNSGDRTPSEFQFKPYALWYCQRAWYVVGKRSDRRGPRFLKLNRFTGVTSTDNPYHIPDGFDLSKELGHAWRMIRGTQRHDVAIRFKQPFAETVSETRWHPTQQEEWSDDQQHVTLRFTVDGLDEIVWWVLGYGPGAEVLEPPELSEKVHALLIEAGRLYGPEKIPADNTSSPPATTLPECKKPAPAGKPSGPKPASRGNRRRPGRKPER
ncbi:MAG: WYL domain-containing protein [Tepidisphaeraceae bacterium]